jgi:hypothetical protein
VLTFAVGSDIPIPSTDHPLWFDGLAQYIADLRTAGTLITYQGDVLVKIYNPLAGPPNYPLYEDTFSLAGVSSQEMPPEVALCVSYFNTLENTVARGRRRGRHFVPGIPSGSVSNGRPNSTLQQAVANAFADYLSDPLPGSTNPDVPIPCIYSRINGEGYLINRAWVDNEFDTQRRRGLKATVRFYPTGWGP